VLFLESLARPILICHAIAAAVLVGSTTHHLLWCRHYLRGRYGQIKAEKRFATIAACAYLTTFTIGNLLYPTYKVRVRAEYLDNPPAIAAEARLRAGEHRAVAESEGGPAATTMPDLTRVSHLFDIKEHWVALGCAASVLLWILSRKAHPREHAQVLTLYLGLAAFACGAAWLGALIGLVTASYRSVGGAM
jgi:hypothetical protein